MVGSTANLFLVSDPSTFSVTIGDVTFSSLGDFSLIVADDTPNTGALGGVLDAFSVADGTVDAAGVDNSGTQILANGLVLNATSFMSLSLQDAVSAGALDSVLPPTADTLNNVAFPNFNPGFGQIDGTNANGDSLFISYTVDEISAVSVPVPEPTAIGLVLIGAVGISLKRRRTSLSR